MSKFIGIKNGKIQIISDNIFNNADLQILELPEALCDIPSEKLLSEYIVKNNQIINKFTPLVAKHMKVAFVSNYAQACGLSTYFENLLQSLMGKVGDFKLFIETNAHATVSLSNISNEQMVTCWSRGEPLNNLIKELKEYNPDLIVINHEFGLYPNARHWMSMMTQLSNYKILTILHSVFPYHYDKIIVEASMKNILVHSEEARQVLYNKGSRSNIYVIPHGCYASTNQDKLWNFYKSDATFMQIGFGFKYKAFEDCIKATALLKETYPNIFFTALFSESPHAKIEHDSYYNYLIELTNELKVQDNVSIIRGFQDDKVIDAFLRTNKVAVFPYKLSEAHLVYGASGAARLAMSKNIPVITSGIPHFADLPTIKANDVNEIAKELGALFANRSKMVEQINKQNIFIANNSWEITANKYIQVFESTLA